MTTKLIYQLFILVIMACCITAIMVMTIHTIQDLVDSASAHVSRIRVPMP